MSAASEDLRQLWQRQALDAPRINLAYLQHQVGRLQRRTRLRNSFEYVGAIGAFVWVIWAGRGFIAPRPIMTAGILLWVLGMLFVAFQWHRRAAMASPAEQLGTLDALQFYRQQLERQRDARRGNWRGWLPPLAPCLVVLFIAMVVEVTPTPWVALGALAGWVAFAVPMSILGYERAARGIQREIDALDSMGRPGT